MAGEDFKEKHQKELATNYQARLEAFYEGAKLVAQYQPVKEQPEEMNALITNDKLDPILKKYQLYAQDPSKINPKNYKMALALFKKDLAQALKVSAKDIQKGEAYWAWQTSSERKTKEIKSSELPFENSKNEMVTVTVSETFIRLPLTKKQKEELLKTLTDDKPLWFSKRAKWEQEALKADLREALVIKADTPPNVETYITNKGWNVFSERSIPATLKWLPIVGVSEHVLKVGDVEYIGYRTSIPVPYDAKLKEQQRLTDMNMAQISEGLSAHHQQEQKQEQINANVEVTARNIMLVSLITGDKSEGWTSYVGLGLYDLTIGLLSGPFKENNARWVTVEDTAIEGKNITHYNFGINNYRSATPVKIDEGYIKSLSDNAHINPFKKALEAHNKKIDELTFLQKSMSSEKYDRNPNLFSAALIDAAERWEGGISAGHCKSSKDRKGIELLMADTIMVYQALYNKVPGYDDAGNDRKNFLQIACQLYRTGVYAEVAAFHSPGSKGLKDDGFTPKDLQEALADDYKLSKIQASWNKPSLPSNIFSEILFVIGVVITPFGILFPPLFFVGAGLIIAAGVREANRRFQIGQLKNELNTLLANANVNVNVNNDENSTSQKGFIKGEPDDDENIDRGHTMA